VLNHKAAADKKEKVTVVEVDDNDRTKEVSDAYEISAWLGFDFPGRGDKYSKLKYHWYDLLSLGLRYSNADDSFQVPLLRYRLRCNKRPHCHLQDSRREQKMVKHCR